MIYLDHNATSPLLPEVQEAMRPWFGVPANPASTHRAGQRAAMAVDTAREQVAALVGMAPEGVVFTSGATEANHMAIRGHRGVERVALGGLEHPCVQGAVEVLVGQGARVHWLPVEAGGRVRLTELPEDIDLLCLMAANHETGIIQDLETARQLVVRRGAKLHVDATQAAGRIPLALKGVDSVALSSHKLGGPGGIGALVLPDGEPFPPLLTGGSQERGRRAGTVHTAAAVGFGAACELARAEQASRASRWSRLSERLRRGLVSLGARIVGDPTWLLPNTTCAIFPGLRGDDLVVALDLAGICASSGAACASGSPEPSPVLVAMGDPEPHGAIRFSLGPRSTEAEVEALLERLPGLLEGARLAALLEQGF